MNVRLAERDLILLPPEKATLQDTLEIRLQCRIDLNNPLRNVTFYRDRIGQETLLAPGTNTIHPEWYLSVSRIPLAAWTPGEHRIIAVAEFADGEQKTLEKKLHVDAVQMALLDGGFLMLGAPADRKPCDPFRDAVMALDDDAWQRQMDGWNRLGMKTFVIFDTYLPLKLSSDAFAAYYPSRLLPKAPVAADDPIAAILEAADRNGQNIFIGLSGWKGFFSKLPEELLEELFNRYRKFKSFYGWYASLEYPISWVDFESVEKYWAQIRLSTGKLSPAMPLLSSPYHPTLLFDFPQELDFQNPDFPDYMHYGIHPAFSNLLRESPSRPDILMVQDGVGRRRPILNRKDLIDVNFRTFAEIRRACDDAGIHCWSNVESFDFSENGEKLLPRYYNGGFDGERGFVQQLESVFRFSERILTFSLTGFFAPSGVEPALGGEAALEQARNYETYRKHPIRDYENLAAGKSYSITPEPSPLLSDRTPGKLTDGLIAGGCAVDIDSGRMVGYDSRQADDAGNLMVEIIIDLEQPLTFDRVRIAGSIQRIRGRADRLNVAVRNDQGDNWHDAGSTSVYRLGFLEVNLQKVATARYVRLRVYKHFPTDINKSWQDSWLLLDEIEIAAARSGEMGSVEAVPDIIQT